MDWPNKEVSVHGLVGELCKRFFDKHTPEEHPYLPRKDNSGALRRLRARAFEILLKKTAKNYDDNQRGDADPVAELLKHAFVLKTALKKGSKAEQLEDSLDLLIDDGLDSDPAVYSTLQFLNGLKSLDHKDENALTVFHYGRANPVLPEERSDPKGPPKYQMYPLESFLLPKKFEAMLGIESDCSGRDNCRDVRSNLSFESQFRSVATLGIETLSTRSDQTMNSVLSVPRYTVRLVSTQQFSMSSHFMPEIMENNDEPRFEYFTGETCRIPGPEITEPQWLSVESAKNDEETNSELSDDQSTLIRSNEKMQNVEDSSMMIWEDIYDQPEVKEHRTWESLGHFQAPKEPPFITETRDAMFHLETIKQAGFLPLLSLNVVESLNPIVEVPTMEFLANIKLLLLGVESETFRWNDNGFFELRENTTVPGLSVDALRSLCTDLTHWGACYRSLSTLTKPDPQTGKMFQDGLIFQAMCNSVKELLIYYQAVILRITVTRDHASPALLRLLTRVRPVGCLIAEVARLCRCDRNDKSSLGEGTGLLSHIYDQVTKITKPNVALVFYSILKSCCEVYFRMLQKWLFEGNCDDDYGEFMIKTRPQFLREKSHRFWSKGFAINCNSVPAFLSHLADPILDCGKTVKLLKICDPKNNLSSMFSSCRPSIRVCLSVGMVREQEIHCRRYFVDGETKLGRNISFARAFDDERFVEKQRIDLVVDAQRETLSRIKREREEAKIQLVLHKRELLAQLKDQVEEVATRKTKERQDELMKDKKLLEDINAAEKIAKDAETLEKINVMNYYNELAAEAEKRRSRSEWRLKRMKLFQQRVDKLNSEKIELAEEDSALLSSKHDKNEMEEILVDEFVDQDEEKNQNPEKSKTNVEDSKVATKDENKNSTQVEIIETIEEKESETPTKKVSPKIVVKDVEKIDESKPMEKSYSLDENRTRMMSGIAISNLNDYQQTPEINNKNTEKIPNRPKHLKLNTDDNATVALKNKLKVLQQEYGMTPNNNELTIILMDDQGNENHISIDAATVVPSNFRKTTKIDDNENISTSEVEKNRNRNMAHQINAIDDFSRPHRVQGSVNLAQAQINRDRNMGHTYNDVFHEKQMIQVNDEDFTELQRNRARVMGHDVRNYQDYTNVEKNSQTNVSEIFPQQQQILQDDGVTPMSCTTDTFPLSMCSSMIQSQNCEDDNYSKNEMQTPDFTSSDNLESRPGTGFNFPVENQASTNFFGVQSSSSSLATPNFESTLTVADVEMIDNTSLQVYLEKSVTIPLKIQSRLANAAIMKFMINEMRILSHLHSLRSFFFLLNGEFAKSLTSSIYKRLYEISQPIELFRPATLTNILDNALNSSFSNSWTNSRLLSLTATDVPSQLQVSNPEFLNCLCLHYEISWPLNIILDERLMQQYSKVFKFLLMVGRVLYVVQEDFHLLKIERKACNSVHYHKLQLYRHSMMQFITAFHNYLTCSVLHASWTEFEKDLETATTVNQIYITHVTYIKKILSRCMLTARGEKMRNFLCNIFKVILKFHNRVRSQNWEINGGNYTHGNFERLEQMYRTFCDARCYLAHVANKLASSGYQPHLTHFLNALNINPLYDLTGSSGSKKS